MQDAAAGADAPLSHGSVKAFFEWIWAQAPAIADESVVEQREAIVHLCVYCLPDLLTDALVVDAGHIPFIELLFALPQVESYRPLKQCKVAFTISKVTNGARQIDVAHHVAPGHNFAVTLSYPQNNADVFPNNGNAYYLVINCDDVKIEISLQTVAPPNVIDSAGGESAAAFLDWCV